MRDGDHEKLYEDRQGELVSLIRDTIQRKRVEEELRWFKTIIETSMEAVSISDPDGRILYVNPAHERLFGRSLAEARRLNFRDYYPLESVDRMDREVVPAGYWEGELDVYDASGRRFPLWHSCGEVLDDEGNKQYGYAFMHDITERKEAEERLRESEAQLRAAAEGRLDAFLILRSERDSLGRIVDFSFLEMNSRAEEQFAMPREKVIGQRAGEMPVTCWIHDSLGKCIEVAETGEPVEEELRMETSQGDTVWYRRQIIPLAHGVAISNRDVTERKRLEREAAVKEERQRLARELHDSVTQSIYSLTLLSEGWRRHARTATPDEVEGWLKTLGSTTVQILKELRLLLYELHPVELVRQGLRSAISHRLQSVEERSGIRAELRVEDVGLTPAIEEQFFMIVSEALNNALKHANATEVEVALRREESVVRLSVVDNGCGFDTSETSLRPGFGLPSMAQRAARIGGALSIRSAPGDGTCVDVRLEVGGRHR
jgi:PAS domain S-box-containing protein